MYSRSFRPSQNRTEGDVPVQYFGDSFSPDAFNSKQKSLNIQSKEENDAENKQQEPKNEQALDKKIAPTNTARKYDIEDLVLLGLLMLFATDMNDKEDIIIPVILGAILLF